MQTSKQQQQKNHTKNQPKPGANKYGEKKKKKKGGIWAASNIHRQLKS